MNFPKKTRRKALQPYISGETETTKYASLNKINYLQQLFGFRKSLTMYTIQVSIQKV